MPAGVLTLVIPVLFLIGIAAYWWWVARLQSKR